MSRSHVPKALRERVTAQARRRCGYSIDRLFRFLNALGRDVEIVIRPARQV